MRLRALLVGLLFVSCVDLTVTIKVPCTATLVRGDSLSDTLSHFTADSIGCPKP